jgi:MoxR-like ATPase
MTRTRTPPPAQSAAELMVHRAGELLERRLQWLAENDGPDLPDAERAWARTKPRRTGTDAARRLKGPAGATWQRLVELFGLTAAEAALLQFSIAVAAEPALGPMVARGQGADDRLLPTEALVKRLADLPARPIWRPGGPLASWGLLRPIRLAPGEPWEFEADPVVVDWMFGVGSLDPGLRLAVETSADGPIPREWPIDAAAERLGRALDGGPARLVVEGRPGAGRRRFGAAVAEALGRKALIVDPVPLSGGDWVDSFTRIQRFALFSDRAVIWREGAPAWPGRVALAPIQVVCVDEGAAAPARDGIVDLHLPLPEPGVESKATIWRQLVPELGESSDDIAALPGLSLSDLELASRARPRTVEDAGNHLRAMARARLQGAGRAVDPQFSWKDLVVSEEVETQLRRIAFEARTRARVLADPETARVFTGAAGLSALFSGPPGVGKSMAAQVIADELGVNLLVVDLAATISKYVGETAKNLTTAFTRARAAGAALIFEEADAFFARRTDVKDSNDRHANADTGHLLQLLEAHDSLVILSTNRRSAIDFAFIRRLRHVVEFPRPGVSERRRVWEALLAVMGEDATALANDIDRLAARFELSPAQIKGAVLSARYASFAVGPKLRVAELEAGAARELAKDGRSAAVGAKPAVRAVGGHRA